MNRSINHNHLTSVLSHMPYHNAFPFASVMREFKIPAILIRDAVQNVYRVCLPSLHFGTAADASRSNVGPGIRVTACSFIFETDHREETAHIRVAATEVFLDSLIQINGSSGLDTN